MRSFPRFAGLRYFAVAAMLLLCFAPSVSRLLAAPGPERGWVQLCTMSGIKQVWLDDAGALPSKSDPAGEDCAYCPLLGAMAAVALLTLLLAAERRVPQPWRLPAIPLPASAFLGSLGARGPPCAI
jgi:hypothetical protein